jgi:hypothetical protein
MNERIKELAEQAELIEIVDDAYQERGTWQPFVEKFAELIVKECTKVVENLSPGYDDYRNQIEDAFRRDCVEQMKQHFGVKE